MKRVRLRWSIRDTFWLTAVVAALCVALAAERGRRRAVAEKDRLDWRHHQPQRMAEDWHATVRLLDTAARDLENGEDPDVAADYFRQLADSMRDDKLRDINKYAE